MNKELQNRIQKAQDRYDYFDNLLQNLSQQAARMDSEITDADLRAIYLHKKRHANVLELYAALDFENQVDPYYANNIFKN